MTSSHAGVVIPGDADVEATPVVQDIHPRLFVRIQLIALARMRDTLIAQLDRLITGLGRLCELTHRFSTQADRARDLRGQLVSTEIKSPDSLVLLNHQIEKYMADLTADFAAFDPAVGGALTTK